MMVEALAAVLTVHLIRHITNPHRRPAKRKEVQLVLSIGDQLDPEQIGPLARNTIVVKRAPQLELLKPASVYHPCGFEHVLESLAQGVPQVATPGTVDEPGVATRIGATKTGQFLPLKELSVSRLSLLLDRVLKDSAYRDAAPSCPGDC
jgi:zeaxanthin glucosyltransferase